MKKIKFSLCIVLTLIIAFSATSVSFAVSESVSLNFLNCNVAGLPDLISMVEKDKISVRQRQEEIGKIFNSSKYDVIAVQEDFNYHKNLSNQMSEFKYRTNFSGGVPGGDGLNVFTKNNPVYNEQRVKWDSIYGPITEGDTLTAKGFLYCVIDLGNGMTVDFYDIHADAFSGTENSLSRYNEYLQLLGFIDKNSKDRPVIITGDFNTSIHLKGEGDDGKDEEFLYNAVTQFGFKDAWTQVKNDGNYDDFSKWSVQYPNNYWGKWDSVEKFLYRSGGGIEISANEFEYIDLKSEAGENYSDHSSAFCKFNFTKTDSFEADARQLQKTPENILHRIFNFIKWVIKDLIYVCSHFDELLSHIGK